MTANRAVLDLASKYREDLLYNIYRMGRNSIERGSQRFLDHHAEAHRGAERGRGQGEGADAQAGTARRGAAAPDPRIATGLLRSARRAARFRPSSTPRCCTIRRCAIRAATSFLPISRTFPTATKFINALIKNGITVQRATAAFEVAGKQYPAGSWVVKTRAGVPPAHSGHVRAAGSSQRFSISGRPADSALRRHRLHAGFQMGVQFDRILDAFDGPFEKVNGLQKPPAGKILGLGATRPAI